MTLDRRALLGAAAAGTLAYTGVDPALAAAGVMLAGAGLEAARAHRPDA